jgi:hypothetical protein
VECFVLQPIDRGSPASPSYRSEGHEIERTILALDEVQKAAGWAESVKRLWDEDTRHKRPLKVVLLGSAPLLIQRGLTESLAGRFEVLHRERNREVDYVVKAGRTVTAIEVKSGRVVETLPGMAAFAEAYTPERMLLVGGDGISVEEFLLNPVEHWVRA